MTAPTFKSHSLPPEDMTLTNRPGANLVPRFLFSPTVKGPVTSQRNNNNNRKKTIGRDSLGFTGNIFSCADDLESCSCCKGCSSCASCAKSAACYRGCWLSGGPVGLGPGTLRSIHLYHFLRRGKLDGGGGVCGTGSAVGAEAAVASNAWTKPGLSVGLRWG